MGLASLVATAGFLFGIALAVIEYRRRLVYLAGVLFTAAQIVVWYGVNRPAGLEDLSPVEAIDKVAQVLLILALVDIFVASNDTIRIVTDNRICWRSPPRSTNELSRLSDRHLLEYPADTHRLNHPNTGLRLRIR